MSIKCIKPHLFLSAFLYSCMSTAIAAPAISTPMLESSSGFTCRIINVSGKSLTLTAELVDANGVVIDTGGPCLTPPGAEACFASGNDVRAYCRFKGGSKSQIRGTIISDEGEALSAQ